MKKITLLFLLIAVFFNNITKAQCGGLTITPATTCAGAPVTVKVNNPNKSTQYRIILNGVTFTDTVGIFTLPGSTSSQQFAADLQFLNGFNQWTSCYNVFNPGPKVTVNASPDPALTEANNFTSCNQSAASFAITVTNTSSTKPSNTNYTINWGDGTPNYTDASFSSPVAHTYAVKGLYNLVLTVTGTGAGGCGTVSKTYTVFFGNAPTNPLFNSGSTYEGCAPVSFKFPVITSINNNNADGTTYSMFINSDKVNSYTKATLPDSLAYTFTQSSCGKTCAGTQNIYCVQLKAENQCSFATTTISPIIISDKPIAQNSITPNPACINQTVTFTNTSQSKLAEIQSGNVVCKPIDDANWIITPKTGWTSSVAPGADDTIRDTKTFTVVFNTKGTYTVTMLIKSKCGVDVITKTITVKDRLTANAVADKIIGCKNLDVSFTNSSSVDAFVKYKWTITPADGSTSFINSTSDTSYNTQIRFTKAGNYTVKLDVKSDSACSNASWSQAITVLDTPSVLKNGIIPNLCSVPSTLINLQNYFTRSNGNDNTATTLWTMTGGTPNTSTANNPSVTYNTPGNYTINLQLTNACGVSIDSSSFVVLSNTPPNAGPDVDICKSSSNITLTAAPTGGIWKGTGIIDTINGVFSTSGISVGIKNITYSITTNGCVIRDSVKINVIKSPVTVPNETFCLNQGNVTLIGNPTYPNGIWQGTGVINNTLGVFNTINAGIGTFNISYIYTEPIKGCIDTAIKQIIVYDSIRLNNLTPSACVNKEFDFTGLASNYISATWDFGDGSLQETLLNPKHTYTSGGTFIVTFIAESINGCKDTFKIPFNVITLPNTRFDVSPKIGCDSVRATFTILDGIGASKFIWNFGLYKDSSVTPINQTVTFPRPTFADTTYIITLTAKYPCGDVFSFDTVTVKIKPIANFGLPISIGCDGFSPTLFNSSLGSITTYNWNFGNGQTSSIKNPPTGTPTYGNTSKNDTIYTIKLIVSNICGSDSIQKNVTIKGNNTVAVFSADKLFGCQPLEVTFADQSTLGALLSWNFGDGTSPTSGSAVTHTFANAGTFTVKLIAKTTCGKDSMMQTIVVNPRPILSYTNTVATCVGTPVVFTNTSLFTTSYKWYFSDASTYSTTGLTKTFTTAGNYDVKLVGVNQFGCTDSIQRTINILVTPDADFSIVDNVVCDGVPIVFINNSNNATNYLWKFGDGTTSIAATPTKTYNAPGFYDVTLITDNGGVCIDSIKKSSIVSVLQTPIANFNFTLTGQDLKSDINFTNLTSYANKYLWQFGDGNVTNDKDPIHKYTGVGPYLVLLTAENDNGCSDTISKIVSVEYDGFVYVPNAFIPETGDAETAIFKPKGVGLKEYTVQVFSTYGQLLWESSRIENGQPTEGWDGKYNGTLMPQDVYVWKIRAIFDSGKSWEGTSNDKNDKKTTFGSVVLIR